MNLKRGKLVLSKKGTPQIEIDGKLFNLAQGELSQSIIKKLKELNGVEVEFEMDKGQPKRIREVGASFVPAQPLSVTAHGKKLPPKQSQSRSHMYKQETAFSYTPTPSSKLTPDFHNPYNFIPAPPRNIKDQDLGDSRPIAQDRFYTDRITGRISVCMEAVTPLLVPDSEHSQEEDNGHKILPLLLDNEGKPILPSSSIRGMLRSAYEAVTNSRFGRFPRKEHSKRLAYRMDPREGLRLIPARIENGRIRLLTGTSCVGEGGKPQGSLYAAWLPRYSGNGKNTSSALTYPNGTLPQHGDEVECQVEMVKHYSNKFEYWKVTKIVKKEDGIENQSESQKQIQGWVCITNANIDRKHDERVFFHSKGSKAPGPFPLKESHKAMWRELIGNYQAIHEKDLEKRRQRGQAYDAYLGPNPGQTAWSRHIYTQDDLELKDGTLCYVRLNDNKSDVVAIFPVMISRELYSVSPWDLLEPSLRSASKIDELSPADRVFGWVLGDSDIQKSPSEEQTSVRGLLRIGPVTCESSPKDSVEEFMDKGLPLAILAAPKPQQGRFYVAASPRGEAQPDGLTKAQAGYANGKGLRGRKVYPHHQALPKNYWNNPTEDRTQNEKGPWQEYRRPRKNGEEQRDDQNRSVLGWIKPGATFRFDIYVTNLSKVELGALLYLLQLPEGYYHRFGGGKPLGFGSVRLSIAECNLWTGESLCKKYCSWDSKDNPEDLSKECIDAFKKAVSRAYGGDKYKNFEDIIFIKAFLRACKGFDDCHPIHYPRTTPNGRPGPPSPAGESFKWFVANEKKEHRFVLRNLWEDNGLPTMKD